MFQASSYLQLKTFHQITVGLSLSLFALRWVGVLLKARWPMRVAVRRASVVVDSFLLGAGVGLWWMGHWNPIVNPWLGTKLLLLVVYIVLGTWALKRARSTFGHVLFGLLALGTAAYMVGVALRHQPGGWFVSLMTDGFAANFFVPTALC